MEYTHCEGQQTDLMCCRWNYHYQKVGGRLV